MDNLVDSHAHLDLLDDPAQALEAAAAVGVRRIMAVGIDLETSRRAVAFAWSRAEVSAAVGIHPHNAARTGSDTMKRLAEMAQSPAVSAIGETGLDYYRDRAPRKAQKDMFRRQIELARRCNLPLIVHSRDAEEDTLEILGAEADGLTVVLHCFSLYRYVSRCAESGYYMSVAGNVTFSNAADLRKASTLIPSELLLTETDAPLLTPAPYRGKENSPAHIPLIVAELAAIRDVSPKDLAESIYGNFTGAFGRTEGI